MKILTLNCGSSSIKYQFIDMKTKEALGKGMISRIGMAGSVVDFQPSQKAPWRYSADLYDHNMAIDQVLKTLIHADHGVISTIKEIKAVGHRVVHGGEKFTSSVLLTNNIDVMNMLYQCIDMAPLHNPPNIKGIEAVKKLLPEIPQVAVFDTSFHTTMPPKAFIYGLPWSIYSQEGIRRFGFHGTSHFFVSREAAKLLQKPLSDLFLISAHLGNGASMAAIKQGKSIDTSMGFTPVEGLLMGTRVGDIDPSIVLLIMAKRELTIHEGQALLNKHSGLLGISGISSDLRDIIEASKKGNAQATLAIDTFCYRITKYVGAYAAAMGGLNAFVFTAGVGENSAFIRQQVCEPLGFLGIHLDQAANEACKGKPAIISKPDSPVKVMVIPTNEELIIAEDTLRIVQHHESNKGSQETDSLLNDADDCQREM